MGIEASFKFVSPCPYLPDYIALAKRVLKLLMWWNWIPCILKLEVLKSTKVAVMNILVSPLTIICHCKNKLIKSTRKPQVA